MQVGDVAQVAFEDPRPLRFRQEPNLMGEILLELEPGNRFTLVGGPICADGYLWWETNFEGMEAWAAEGTPGNYFMEMVERRNIQVPADEVDPEAFPTLAPGIYMLEMQAPEVTISGRDPLEHIAVVATANITLKFSIDSVFAWVTDLESGLPLADVPVTFYNENFRQLGRLNTNADGVAQLEIPQLDDLYVTLRASVQTPQTFGVASSTWDSGIDPWRFDVRTDYQPEDFAVYLYTDRPIYRPDQPVYFRGVARRRDDVRLSVPTLEGNSVPITIYDPEDEIIYEGNAALTPHGTFSGSFELSPEAALGYYRLVAGVGSNQRRSFSLGFSVAEYAAPEFQVEVTLPKRKSPRRRNSGAGGKPLLLWRGREQRRRGMDRRQQRLLL
ncbi:MAG: hypothetical protein HC915_11440 [Anaerolineae bacterium]|nr:hypothetical protein [Anaerolineae bacterium]